VSARRGCWTSWRVAEPLGQSVPWLMGERGWPSMSTSSPRELYTICPQPTAQYGQTDSVAFSPAMRAPTFLVFLETARGPRPQCHGFPGTTHNYPGAAMRHHAGGQVTWTVMQHAAGIVLAGGRSSRMGTPKASLEWHGSTLLRRVAGLVQRSVGGPVIVVSAPGQELPALPAGIEVVEDSREGRGPLQGLAAGLASVGDRAVVAYVSSTDVPLLHPRFIRHVLAAFDHDVDVVLPVAGGFRHPLAAAYRVALVDAVERLIAEDRLKPAFLFDECRVRRLDDRALLADPVLAALDPHLASVLNLNEPADYEAARARRDRR
jgi:molybdenum cofactor guanylyltransferase